MAIEASPDPNPELWRTSILNRFSASFPASFLLLLLCWGLINLLQAAYTELNPDEAYYWMYSRYLAWGYFDHPPMIAWMIKAGNMLLNHEIGTRLLVVLAQLVTLMIVWNLTGERSATHKKIILFFGIAASVAMFQFYGFIATPDSPLLLFTALFLFAYQKFLEKENIWHVMLISLSAAALMYSKYHGGLIILLVILSNLRLLINVRFWLAGILAIILFMPHILWQMNHEFPTLQYHLVTRARPMNIKHVLNFFPNQLLAFNPLFLGATIFIIFKFRPKDTFERALYFITSGFLLFFLFSTLRGHAEPHWTIAASVGMIIMLYRKCMDYLPIQKFAWKVLIPSIVCILFVRAALIIDFLPFNTRFHGHAQWCKELASIAGNTPVIFRNSYQSPSLYTYYTGLPATTLNSIYYRKNQYDLWPFEETFFGKPAILVTNVNDPLSKRFTFQNGKKMYLHPTNQFFAVQKLTISYAPPPSDVHAGDSLTLHCELFNPYPYAIRFDSPEFPVLFNTLFIKSGNDMTVTPGIISPSLTELKPEEKVAFNIRFDIPDICPRQYKFGISLQAGIIQEAYNSPLTSITVRDK